MQPGACPWLARLFEALTWPFAVEWCGEYPTVELGDFRVSQRKYVGDGKLATLTSGLVRWGRRYAGRAAAVPSCGARNRVRSFSGGL
jgi:hypothetical protein